jgi:hypothetical protein
LIAEVDVYKIVWPEYSHRYIIEHLSHAECPNAGDMLSHLQESHNFRKRVEQIGDILVELYRPVDIHYLRCWVEKTRYVADEYRATLLGIVDVMNHDINVWMSFT